jgi:hypothetical protein
MSMIRTVGLVMLVVASGCGTAERAEKLEASKRDRARLAVMKLANEGFPMWAARHMDAACPRSVDELAQLLWDREERDPWGRPFVIQCGADLPPGAHGIAISSLGRDGAPNTADDIASWK